MANLGHKGLPETLSMRVPEVPRRSLISPDRVGISKTIALRHAHGEPGTRGVAMDGVSRTRRDPGSDSPEHGSGQVQRSGRMRFQQLSWKHPAETSHPGC